MSDRPSVLAITHSESLSGAERDLLAVRDALAAEWNLVIVRPDRVGSLSRHCEQLRVPTLLAPMPPWIHSGFPGFSPRWWLGAARSAAAILRHSRDRRPVLLHCNSVKAALFAFPAALVLGVPILLHQHDILALTPRNRWLMRLLSRTMLRAIAVSEAVRANLLALGVNAEQTALCYNYIYGPESEPPAGDRRAMRETLGLDDDAIAVLSVGQLTEWKGVDGIIRSFALARSSQPALRLLVAGVPLSAESDDYARSLRRLAEELGAASSIDFLGYRADVPALMHAADLYVHGARRPDPFPLTVIEALRAGRAVVATRSGGVPEMVSDGVNGRLVDMEDWVGLGGALAALAASATLRDTYGAASRRLLEERFDGVANLGVMQHAYRELVSHRHE